MKTAYNPKREQILETGKELFWKFGFTRVTVEEICKEAGISKMTFYKYFSNKTELVKTLLGKILNTSMEKYRRIMESPIPYPEKVTQMIELKREQTHTMSSEFFRDYLQSGDPELMAFLQKLSNESLQIFTEDFRKAQQNGDIRKDLKVEFILAVMNRLVEWAQQDKALLDMYDEPQDLAVEITSFIFYGILNREQHP
jgi:AcrR family transcriptional regulator